MSYPKTKLFHYFVFLNPLFLGAFMSFFAQRSIIRTATLFLTASWIIGCGDDSSSTGTTGIEVIVADGGLSTTETGGTASFVI
ncbi:MAG: hypothetical protein AAF550_02575, partial [Myxococcota bacterium]